MPVYCINIFAYQIHIYVVTSHIYLCIYGAHVFASSIVIATGHPAVFAHPKHPLRRCRRLQLRRSRGSCAGGHIPGPCTQSVGYWCAAGEAAAGSTHTEVVDGGAATATATRGEVMVLLACMNYIVYDCMCVF